MRTSTTSFSTSALVIVRLYGWDLLSARQAAVYNGGDRSTELICFRPASTGSALCNGPMDFIAYDQLRCSTCSVVHRNQCGVL